MDRESVDRRKALQRMAELLRSGAVMLDQTCPICGLPLFKLRSGEIICPIHGSIRVVSTESEAISATTEAVLDELEKHVAYKVGQLIREASRGELELSDKYDEISKLLDIIERIRRIKSLSRPSTGVEGKK
jgi:UPF0148 protein